MHVETVKKSVYMFIVKSLYGSVGVLCQRCNLSEREVNMLSITVNDKALPYF